MAVLDFLSRKGRRRVSAAIFDHGTGAHDHGLSVLIPYCRERDIPLLQGKIRRERPKGQSPEQFWREERYGWIHTLPGVVVTGHQLDDVAETWLMTSLRGRPTLIPRRRGNVLRPFLETPRTNMLTWCQTNSVPYWNDPSNTDTRFGRNAIRHNLLPSALSVYPGLLTTMARLIRNRDRIEAEEQKTVTEIVG